VNFSKGEEILYMVPERTAEVARAVFPKGNLYLTLFNTFDSLFADLDFAALFPDNGQPALSPVRLEYDVTWSDRPALILAGKPV